MTGFGMPGSPVLAYLAASASERTGYPGINQPMWLPSASVTSTPGRPLSSLGVGLSGRNQVAASKYPTSPFSMTAKRSRTGASDDTDDVATPSALTATGALEPRTTNNMVTATTAAATTAAPTATRRITRQVCHRPTVAASPLRAGMEARERHLSSY